MADSRPEFPQEWRDALKRDGALPAGSCDCDECVGNVLTALAEAGALRVRDPLGNPMGWTPEQIRRNEEFNASLPPSEDD